MQQHFGLEKRPPSKNRSFFLFCRFEPIQTSELQFDNEEERSQQNKKRNRISQSSLQMSREESGGNDYPRFNSLMSACKQNLEHNVTRILLKKVSKASRTQHVSWYGST